MNGQMPQQVADQWVASISLDPEAMFVRTQEGLTAIPTDEAPAQAWGMALTALSAGDANTPLPDKV
jgi:hypothetical protein